MGPDGATFEDGYQVALISEAMLASAASGGLIEIEPVRTASVGTHRQPATNVSPIWTGFPVEISLLPIKETPWRL